MARLLRERDLDQQMWEGSNFSLLAAEEVLARMDPLVKAAAARIERDAEADMAAAELEARALARITELKDHFDHEMEEAKDDLKAARDRRIVTKRGHAASRAEYEEFLKTEKLARLHVHRTRAAIADWAGQKDFAEDQLPELQVMAAGGLKRLIAAHKRTLPDAQETAMSTSEAEVI